MSIQRKPLIRQLSNKNKVKIHGMDIKFKIDSDIKSVDIESIFFTNFLKKDKVKLKFVKNEIRKIKSNEIDGANYEIKEENYSKKNQNRIKLVYENTYNQTNTSPLIRIKQLENKEFQIYCHDNKGEYFIKLIDVHHLIVPAADKEHSEKIANPKKKYNEVRNGSVDLKDLI